MSAWDKWEQKNFYQHIIVCHSGRRALRHPEGHVTKCETCLCVISAFEASIKRKEDAPENWHLICRDCFARLLKERSAKGKDAVRFGGRISDNKFTGGGNG